MNDWGSIKYTLQSWYIALRMAKVAAAKTGACPTMKSAWSGSISTSWLAVSISAALLLNCSSALRISRSEWPWDCLVCFASSCSCGSTMLDFLDNVSSAWNKLTWTRRTGTEKPVSQFVTVELSSSKRVPLDWLSPVDMTMLKHRKRHLYYLLTYCLENVQSIYVDESLATLRINSDARTKANALIEYAVFDKNYVKKLNPFFT